MAPKYLGLNPSTTNKIFYLISVAISEVNVALHVDLGA
ncbi:hypothetical protein GARC_4591 [Paraglaciecola arctica BSs20135]|uniref:Uncharacterized protein n=1 Tax=Paraglaciecola arctica BSs20135 TaxID=493475 RepID=K6YXQ4_9ALTE|nr:hypothetical protein GARC_4591 [Paraglaciecola arctica BSs20135]